MWSRVVRFVRELVRLRRRKGPRWEFGRHGAGVAASWSRSGASDAGGWGGVRLADGVLNVRTATTALLYDVLQDYWYSWTLYTG